MHIFGRLLISICLLPLLAGLLAASAAKFYKKLREPREFDDVLCLDLDNCLYRRSCKFQEEFFKAIQEYYVNRLRMSQEEASQNYFRFRDQYGSSLKGLYTEYGSSEVGTQFDVDDYIGYQNKNMDYSKITFDAPLFDTLKKVKARLIVVTNSGIMHAERALKILKIHDLVEGIVFADFHDRDYVSKPNPKVYEATEEIASEGRDRSSLRFYFVDDERKNIDQGRAQGWTCLWLQENSDATDHTIGHVSQIEGVWPHLF